MEFSPNSPILFVLVGAIIALVLGQSVYFLVKALRRAKALGINTETLKKTVNSAALFTIAPAISILVGVLALSKSLGLAIPWFRLSVIGSIAYETFAVGSTLEVAGMSAGNVVTDPSVFISIVWVMTIGIAAGLVFVPFLTKRIQSGLSKVSTRDKRWGEIFNNAMFLGMISAFLGYVFCDVGGIVTGSTEGLIPVCVMAVSAVVMAACGLIATKAHVRWMNDYALPISLIAGMASAIPFTSLLGG